MLPPLEDDSDLWPSSMLVVSLFISLLVLSISTVDLFLLWTKGWLVGIVDTR